MRTSIQAMMAAANLYSEYFIGLIMSMIVARNLSTDDYGIYSSLIWLAGLFTLGINSGLSLNVTKFVAEFKKNNIDQLPAILAYFWRIQYFRIAIVCLVSMVVFSINPQLIHLSLWLFIALFISSIIKADYMFKMAIYTGMKRFDIIAKTSLTTNPFKILLVVLFAYYLPTLEGFILVYCGSCIAYGASALLYNQSLPNHHYEQNTVNLHKKRIIQQTISATIIVFIGTLIFRQSQVMILEQYQLFSEAGFFNIAFVLSTAAITLVPGVYQEVLLPKITEAVQTNNVSSQIEQAERYLITLSLLVVFPVIIYADVIIETLFGERYLGATIPLQLMMVFKTILTLNQGANLVLISNDKQIDMAKFHSLLLIIAIILSVIFVPAIGLNGALITYGLLSIILLLGYAGLAKPSHYKMIPLGSILRILLASSIAIIPALLINHYLSGIISAVIGTFLYIIIYLNLLFITKGYDDSVLYLLKQMRKKIHIKPVKSYLNWCINSFNSQ